MTAKQLKSIANTSYILGIVCALMIYTQHTFGYFYVIRTGFYVFGGLGLILSLLQFRFLPENQWGDFNLLFWIGSAVIFIGFAFQNLHIKYASLVLILGLAVTGISYFINPFKRRKDEENDILDN
ncbi:hypothetical protein [Fluviicola sp.]|jgi:hypothetical protein|uniref:hypothetical protein n=1 Tax=Fluviicola sp. TaxID=1917219 RepID=UPI00282D6444|nr:hypothetical protein [Fluviicola sp.]MDR0801724.1 hypothetical protein [Fluviicola sp.]